MPTDQCVFLEKQLNYLVTLLPVSALNRDDIRWRKYTNALVITKRAGPMLYDSFIVQWHALKKHWDISGDSYFDASETGERVDDGYSRSLGLRDNVKDIATLVTLVSKMEQHFAPATQVVALGTMSYDPVEGEPDYVKPCTCGRAAD